MNTTFEIRNLATVTEPAEVLVYENIGTTPWDGSGLTAKGFKNTLDQVTGRDLVLRVNSRGGDVHDGLAIRSLLDSWPGKVSVIIDGIAASTASWIGLGADEIRAAKNSQIFIHDAISFAVGNAGQLREQANALDLTSDQIAGMYAEKTKRPAAEMRDIMRQGKLMTGEDALSLGLVDAITDAPAIANFTPDGLDAIKARLAQAAPPAHNATRAVLQKFGVTVPSNASDDQLAASLERVLVESRRIRLVDEVEQLIRNDQIPACLRDATLARLLNDEAYLAELKALPSKPPGAEPVSRTTEFRDEAPIEREHRQYVARLAAFRKNPKS